jgi:hypothetical protein
MKMFLFAIVLTASPALAQDTTNTLDVTKMKIDHVYPLVVSASGEAGKYTFTMDEGACLRGPLVFFGLYGKEQFRLAAGVEYPSGCGAH